MAWVKAYNSQVSLWCSQQRDNRDWGMNTWAQNWRIGGFSRWWHGNPASLALDLLWSRGLRKSLQLSEQELGRLLKSMFSLISIWSHWKASKVIQLWLMKWWVLAWTFPDKQLTNVTQIYWCSRCRCLSSGWAALGLRWIQGRNCEE